MRFAEHAYENTRRVSFRNGAMFVPRCNKCGRIVKAYKSVRFDGNGQPKGNNAMCKKCGRTQMIWEGYL